MVDEGGEEILGKRAGDIPEGLVPTGADEVAEGSSVETEEEVTADQLPSTAEITEAEGGPPGSGPLPEEEVLLEEFEELEQEEEPAAPHDKGRMADIE